MPGLLVGWEFNVAVASSLLNLSYLSRLDSFELADTLGLTLLMTVDSIGFLVHREYGQAKDVAKVATKFNR
jgi:hypothetical protein